MSDHSTSCGACPQSDCPSRDAGSCPPGDQSGWQLASAALLSFGLPLIACLAGTALLGPEPVRRLIGAVLGLAAGAALASSLCRFLYRQPAGTPSP